ncbi:MAG TPA: PIN domain-containing protein [Polyangiaceae bacterium]|nr:PIN domain-containing protein [Polyangiaceae bacterium]
MTAVFFYDAWAFIALANRLDPGHAVAAALDLELERQGYAAVTTDYILDETITHLNSKASPKIAIEFVEDLLSRVSASEVQLIEINPERWAKAFTLFKRLACSTRQLSFTDATSFAVMHELSITRAFTADRHFHQAGRGVYPLVEKRPSGYAIQKLP